MSFSQELTDIQRFYKNSTVFLTGSTGFIGKLVLEKILRALPVKKVFILVRAKRNVSFHKRFQDIFESPAFDLLKKTSPDVLQNVSAMEGDCSLPMLGLSQEDQKTLIDEVNVIFHVAATVRFDDHIKNSTFINIRATRDLITLAKEMNELKTFVYVGTGFSNCNRAEVREEIYPAKIAADKLIAACEALDDDCLSDITKTLIGNWPNTYTFTKQVTEDCISREGKVIPVCIVRPTIVVSTYSEPVAAFVDSAFTIAGFVLGTAMGITRILYCKNICLDVVPVDFVVNQCIAAGWQTGESFRRNKTDVPVYHASSVMDNPITLDEITTASDFFARQVPSTKALAYPLYFKTTCRYNYLIVRFLFHTVVGYTMDLLLRLTGKKATFSAIIRKLHKTQESYEHFTTSPIFLHMENTHKILRKMSLKDRELFNFDVTTINWRYYFEEYVKGLRIYLLNDPMSTLHKGIKHYNNLRNIFIISLIIFAVFLYVIGKIFLFKVIPIVVSLVLYPLRSTVC